MEYHSIERFTRYCHIYGFIVEKSSSNASCFDLLVNGVKVQMKYAANQSSAKSKRTYSYKISLGKNSGGCKHNVPYEAGDNAIYVIELLPLHGDFLILSEQLLIDRGYIKTTTQEGKYNLDVYPHDYASNPKYKNPEKGKRALRGNWTCDSRLWISTVGPNGCVRK